MHRWKNLRLVRLRPGQILGVRGLAVASGLLAALMGVVPLVSPRADDRRVGTATVRRADFNAVVVASGRAESSNSTEIRCTLERLTTGTTPTIISLVPDGTTVKKGDVLCEIDSSGWREVVRQQEIRVQQAKASYLQARLDLEVTEIEARAFFEGEMRQTDRDYQGQIALAKSDLNRQSDRMEWTEQMKKKGYASTLQVATEVQTMLRTKLSLEQVETAFKNYQRFTGPKTVRMLQSQVNGAKATLGFETIKLNREEERLAHYKLMVEACTVRAPHDGFVIYAGMSGRDPAVDLGIEVRQRQRLFTLPDLSSMEVQAILHETVVSSVRPGMPARIRIEALPGRYYEGTVSSVSPLPLQQRKEETGSEVPYFLAKVALTTSPEGLRPGMSAELEIVTEPRLGVLSVPYTAVAAVGRRRFCKVVHPDRIEPDRVERREIKVGAACHNLLEVVEGLAEGETVLLDASAAGPAPTARSTAKAWWLWN
jgi:HlyD family secretion protein